MTPKIIMFSILLSFVAFLNASKVIFIKNEPYSIPTDNDNISFYLMQNIMKKLDIDFVYEYVDFMEAMQKIENEEDVVIFPYIRPRNMSNRILLSEPLYTLNQKIFYNKLIYDQLTINSLSDLKTYVVGSNAFYQYEIELRRAGLTIHYSNDNQESMQKLVDQEVSFVIEEKIKGLRYLALSEGKHRNNISFYEIDLFPQPFFVAAPVRNENASLTISRINELIEDKRFMDRLTKSFFDDVWYKSAKKNNIALITSLTLISLLGIFIFFSKNKSVSPKE